MKLWWPAMSLVLAAAAAADESDQDLAERIRPCAACHGEHGRSDSELYYPSIAGKPAGYLLSQLRGYREGRRRHVIMEALLAHLSDAYLREIAGYYSRQTPSWTPPRFTSADAELARGRQLVEDGDPALDVPACRGCHGDTLTGVAPSIPGLLGLRPEYLSAQLGAWRTGARRAKAPDCMAVVAERLDREDLRAVTAWIARLPYPAEAEPAPGPPGELPLPCGVSR